MILVSFNGTFDRNNPLHKFILISYSMVATNIIIFLFFYLLKNQNSRSKSMNRVHPNRQQGVQTKCIFPFFGGHHLLMYLCVSVHVSAHLGTNTLHIIAPPPLQVFVIYKGIIWVILWCYTNLQSSLLPGTGQKVCGGWVGSGGVV